MKVPGGDCPSCGSRLDGAAHSEGTDQEPTPGDLTVCLYCGNLMAFADDLTLRALTDKEMHEAAGDPDLLRAQRIAHDYRTDKRNAN